MDKRKGRYELKLNLGSGIKCKVSGFKNVDFIEDPKIDYVHDLNKPLPFEDNSVSAIYSSHIIEHFWWKDTRTILKDWCRVLKKGGTMDIWTIDFDLMIYAKLNHPFDEEAEVMEGINWRMFSKEEPRGNAHHSIFNKPYLIYKLKEAGFTKIQVLDPNCYPFRPLHEGVNMGLRATK